MNTINAAKKIKIQNNAVPVLNIHWFPPLRQSVIGAKLPWQSDGQVRYVLLPSQIPVPQIPTKETFCCRITVFPPTGGEGGDRAHKILVVSNLINSLRVYELPALSNAETVRIGVIWSAELLNLIALQSQVVVGVVIIPPELALKVQ